VIRFGILLVLTTILGGRKFMNGLTSEQLDELRQILEDQRNRLLRNARRSISDQISGGDGLPADTIDVSTDESSKVTELRLRDREKYLIAKIEKTLKRMDEGSYGECHDCGAEIGFARLKARPVAELCIDCKEEQERAEKQVQDRRQEDDKNNFFF
tara:strand:+ start:10020 stop:10487 length:468 start_codon:yes stop_codon:yes gene_type:complete